MTARVRSPPASSHVDDEEMTFLAASHFCAQRAGSTLPRTDRKIQTLCPS